MAQNQKIQNDRTGKGSNPRLVRFRAKKEVQDEGAHLVGQAPQEGSHLVGQVPLWSLLLESVVSGSSSPY